MRTATFLTALLFIPYLLSAKTGNVPVSGKVLDADHKGLEFVNVLLLSAKDSSLKKGVLTHADGKYDFEDVASGEYLVSFSLLGFAKQYMGSFTLDGAEPIILNDVILLPASELQQVNIVTTQPLFSQKPGMLVMNLENSAVKLSGSIYEVLEKAPGVSIDQDGIVSMKGKSGVQIYLDGKPTYLSSDQLRDYLMSMSGSDILKIEMMTTPPAKYNAEGSSGIINIVTKKKQKEGLTGSLSGGLGQGNTTREEGGLNLGYSNAKFSVFGKYDYSTPSREETKGVNRIVMNGSHTTTFGQLVDLRFQLRSQNVKTGFEWFPNQTTTLGIHADGSSLDRNIRLDSRTNIVKVDSGLGSILHQINQTESTFKHGSISCFLNHKLDTSGSEINISLDYMNYQNHATENYNLHFLNSTGTEMAPPGFQRSYPNSDIAIYVGQVDYTCAIRKKYRMEAGLKSSFVNSGNDLLFEVQDPSGAWQKDLTRTNSFTYSELINAAYLDGTVDLGKWQVQAGLRAEQTISDGSSPTTHQDHQNNYIQLFPTVFVSKTISEKHSLQGSLFRRINRPGYNDLNPFYFYVDHYLYRIGNPFLQPEIVNGGDLTYSYKSNLFASMGASRTFFGIAHVTHLTDSTGVMSQTTANMNTIDNGYLSLTWADTPFKWWTNSVSVVINYNHYLATLSGAELDRSNVVYNLNVTESFLLKQGFKLEVSGWYQSPMVYSIFLIQPSGDMSLGLSRSFLKDRLKCTISASDVLYTQAQHVVVDFQDQHLISFYNFDSRYVYLRMRYTFGGPGATKHGQFKNVGDDLQKRVG